MCQQPVTPLTHFAPLIQLWAGICAICFYDSLVNNLVVTEKRKELRDHLAVFIDKLTDGSSLNERAQALMINKIDEKLELFKYRVTHLGKLYCGCAIGLLVIAGFETELHYNYIWLFSALVIASGYCIWLVENKRLTFQKKPWSFLYPLAGIYMILYCGYCDSLFQCEIGNEHWISFMTIMLLVFPVFYLVMTYYIEERMATFRWRLTSSLRAEYDVFARIQSMGGRIFNSPVFSEDLKGILAAAPDRDAKQRAFEGYMIKKLKYAFRYGSVSLFEIHGLIKLSYHKIITLCYQDIQEFITLCCRELRDFWRAYKESLLITIICFVMFSAFILGIYNFR